jgi:hypothetical protein
VRAFLGGGLVCVGVGLLLMSGIDPSDDWTTLLAGFIAGGVGIGLINPPLATAAIGVVEPRRAGAASGINSTFRQVGTAVGIAGLGALLQSKVSDKIDAALAHTPLPHRAVSHISEAVSSGGASAAARSARPAARGRRTGGAARVHRGAERDPGRGRRPGLRGSRPSPAANAPARLRHRHGRSCRLSAAASNPLRARSAQD